MAGHRMTYDELKYEQDSQRGGFNDPYAYDDYYSSGGGGRGGTKGKCLHCEQPGHQWRVCQWRCNHCGTYEHAYVPNARASTQCPALLAKKPRIYEQHNYRHTTDRGNAVGRAEDVAELSHVCCFPAIPTSIRAKAMLTFDRPYRCLSASCRA